MGVIFNMNLALVWFIIYLLLSTEVLTYVVFYADETPEDYDTEQIASRLPPRRRHRPFNSPSAIPEQGPDPGLTSRFPGRTSSSGNISPSADSPSNPRYYEDKQSLTDNLNVIPQAFPRQSKSRDDYDRFALNPNPEHTTLETYQQAEQETGNERGETETSNFFKTYLSDETDPENDHLLKRAVPTDSGYTFDTNFIIFVVGCSAAVVTLLTIIGVCFWCKPRKKANMTSTLEGDNSLSHEAIMRQYRQQKRRINLTQSSSKPLSETDSDNSSDERLLNKFF
jgi:hypothetical protein